MNLVPTASTTAALAMGDALAMSVLVEKGFKPEDFANLHPGGKLGKKLMRVEQLMNAGDALPVVQLHTAMRDVIYEMSRKKLGMTTVVEKDGRLAGIITDGDLRRKMATTPNILDLVRPRRDDDESGHDSADHAGGRGAGLMEQRKITSIVVIDAERRVEGVVHLHDLWKTGMV